MFSTHEGLPGRVMRVGRPSVLADLRQAEDAVFDLEGALGQAGLRPALAVPIRRGMEVLGALLFAARPPQIFSDDDVQVAALLASGLSAGLETSLAYQAAADERSTLAAVLASTADAVLMINQAGVVLLANAAVAPMLGLVPDAITGRPLLEVVDYVPLRQLFAVGQPGTSELTLPDGRTAQASLVPVTTPFGEPVGVAAILRDITLLKNLEQMKNDFVNTVSHDLKNPITIISGLSDLMLRAGPGDDRHAARCQDIRDTAQHMAEMVTDLLDLGKIEAGLDPYREPTDVIPLVGEALRMVTPNAERKSITLHTDLPRTGLGQRGGEPDPAGPHQPDRQRREVHTGRRAGDDQRRLLGRRRRRRDPHHPGDRHRRRYPGPRPTPRLRQVLPGAGGGDPWHRRHRPRPGHHPEHRGDARRAHPGREHRGRRDDLRGGAAAHLVLSAAPRAPERCSEAARRSRRISACPASRT